MSPYGPSKDDVLLRSSRHSTELVTRLRDDDKNADPALCWEAADEIERLSRLGLAPCIAAKLRLSGRQSKSVAAFIRGGLCPIAALLATLKERA